MSASVLGKLQAKVVTNNAFAILKRSKQTVAVENRCILFALKDGGLPEYIALRWSAGSRTGNRIKSEFPKDA
jgi:hypothetical protein